MRDAVAYTLDLPACWGLASEVLEILTATEAASSFGPDLQLPSKGISTHYTYKGKTYTHTILRSLGLPPPNNLFGTGGISVQLCWQYESPIYYGDLDTYISQRHCAPPSFEYVHIFYVPTEIVQRRKVILLFKTPRLLCRYRVLLPRSSLGFSADWCTVLPLLTVYHVIIEDSLEAICGLKRVVTMMVSMTHKTGVISSDSPKS